MQVKRLYYHLKPYLPWRLRMAVRGIMARRKRAVCQDEWPILETAGHPPAGWPGWPDGKKFAFVVTHDVEGPAGLAKCRQLMELEQKLGFRSSFNFIPEGDYSVSREQREELVQNGFEVGVHDLHHDGKLYESQQAFTENARWINHYLKEWGASGFRGGFMLRELDWIHDLDIQYDCSTFDTDPFEPQPDGAGTIFPFWIPRPGAQKSGIGNGKPARPSSQVTGRSSIAPGYVELPYTLPQDSTLFLVLREPTPEIWLRKLDWVASRGGMALVNVHPDYLRFPGEPASPSTFPVAHYVELMEYVRDRYAGTYWQALPRALAEYCAGFRPQKPDVSRRRIAMIAYSVYRRDTRVIGYAETLAGRGDIVDVVALKQEGSQPAAEKVGAVNLYNFQGRYNKNQTTHGEYLWPVIRFWAGATALLAWRQFRRPYDLIHVHNMPDFLVFAAWIPKLLGAKVILDIHDIMPEFYASKFQKGERAFGIRVLKMIERASVRTAHHVIISNHLWLKPFVSRSAPERKCSVFINHVNQEIFCRRPTAGNGNKRIILFPGGLHWHQGLDIAIRAMPAVLKKIPAAEFHIFGDGNMKDELMSLTHDLALTDQVRFFEPLSVSEIAEVMAQADLGVVPKRADSFGNEAYSTKIMEFMSLGVPVVVSSTKIDRFYFNNSVVRFFESGNPGALAEAIVEVFKDDELRRSMIARALEYAQQSSWQRRQGDYLELVDALIENRPIRPVGTRPEEPADDAGGRQKRNGRSEVETDVLTTK
jgi:glycosyltransferase involved in cell wall biosynthesis